MKIKKMKFFESYHDSLDKLLTQESDWFLKRIEYASKDDWIKVKVIEEKYLEPLNKKIIKLARIAKMEVENDKK